MGRAAGPGQLLSALATPRGAAQPYNNSPLALWPRPGASVCHGCGRLWRWHRRRVPVNPCTAGGTWSGSPPRDGRRVGGRTGRSDRCRWRGMSATWPQAGRAAPRRGTGPGEGAPWDARGLHCVCSVCSSRQDGVRVCEQCTAQRLPPPLGANVSPPRWTRWTLPEAPRPSQGCRSRPVGMWGWRYRRAPGRVEGAVTVTSPRGAHSAPLTRL